MTPTALPFHPAAAQARAPLRWLLPCMVALGALALGACSPRGEEVRMVTEAVTTPGLALRSAQAAQPGQVGGAATVVAVARGKLEVEGGLLALHPHSAGVVHTLAVREGQTVDKGALLLRLDDSALQAELSVAEAQWKLAQARAQAEQQRLPALRKTLARWQAAVREGAADVQGQEQAAQAVQEAQTQFNLAQAQAGVAHSQLTQLQARRPLLELRAPEAGTLVRVAVHAGAQVAPGSGAAPALLLLPDKPLQVRAELNEGLVTQVRPGMRAQVVADSENAPTAQALPMATVRRLSPVFGSARLEEDPLRGPSRVVECVLEFDTPPASAVRVGQNVRVSFYE